MEERDNKKCTTKTKSSRGRIHNPQNNFHQLQHYHHHLLLQHHNLFQHPGRNLGFFNQNLYHHQLHPSPPPLLPLPMSPPLPFNHGFWPKPPWKPQNQSHPPPPPPPMAAATSDPFTPRFSDEEALEVLPLTNNNSPMRPKKDERSPLITSTPPPLTVARRPDSGGSEGTVIPLLANHFLVQFDPTQRIYHYDVEISPKPPKDIARLIKNQLIEENVAVFSGAHPSYDGRRSLFSPIEFQNNRLELYVNLPVPKTEDKNQERFILFPKTEEKNQERLEHFPKTEEKNQERFELFPKTEETQERFKLFRVNIKFASKIDGQELSKYLNDKNEWVPLPQDYLQALDVVLRENPSTECIALGRSLYSESMGGVIDVGGGAVGLRGFFQSLRPTQQGLALNVDLSVTAFHESIGVIPYLQKRLGFLHDLSDRKTKRLTFEEKKEVERALKNTRVFVCHRETVQRYRVHSLTEESTENLWFRDRDGKNLWLVGYFKEHYNYDIQFKNLPCLQTSRRRPCYLPMELCVVCEGQKFLGKLSDDQTAKLLRFGCQRPRERKSMIDGVMAGPFGPTSGNQADEFNLRVSTEMTKLTGRVLRPPKLKLGNGGVVRDLTPSRHDRQWNFVGSHVFEGTRIGRWALMSFGGTADQRAAVPRFIDRLSQRCEQLGIFLNKNTLMAPQYEPMQVLNNPLVLETKLKKIQRSAANNLQLLICVMEKKHKGYADLKRIAETGIGVMSQCCLYENLGRLSSQFLANLALKINAKIGGCTVALYTSLSARIPRLLALDEPVMFMGADVTHPHPLDDCSPSVAAVVGSVNWPAANKYVSRMRSQTHRQEIIENLAEMTEEILHDFRREVSRLPRRIVFFRDGVSETQFQVVVRAEVTAVRAACGRFAGYDPSVTFAVVQKRHHTRLFPGPGPGPAPDENVPPGTVVDTVVTHPSEFDFYLCSHWGVKGTSRPTHYHVLWDENGFTSDEFQKLVYDLCFTSVRCTRPVSLVPPCYYAHLAAYRGRLYLDRGGGGGGMSAVTRRGPPKTAPLPELRESVKNLMFYC